MPVGDYKTVTLTLIANKVHNAPNKALESAYDYKGKGYNGNKVAFC